MVNIKGNKSGSNGYSIIAAKFELICHRELKQMNQLSLSLSSRQITSFDRRFFERNGI